VRARSRNAPRRVRIARCPLRTSFRVAPIRSARDRWARDIVRSSLSLAPTSLRDGPWPTQRPRSASEKSSGTFDLLRRGC
jgi:hypothetical protein